MLARLGVLLLMVQAVVAPLLLFSAPSSPEEAAWMVQARLFEDAVMTKGDFFDAVMFRSIGFAIML